MEDGTVICEVGIAEHGSDSEDNPNQSEVGIVREDDSDDNVTTQVESVLVSTSDGLISAEQLRERFPATHIVIQDVHTGEIGEFDPLKAGKTHVVTPFSPCSPNSSSKFRWLDPTLSDAVLPVRCKNANGELHKARFGSGNM